MLSVDVKKRPTCDELIKGRLFQVYTEKINSLDSIDLTFQKTLKNSSPDRAQIRTITNSLLTQLHLPTNGGINGLTNLLPRRNYESAQSNFNNNRSSIKKANSVKMGGEDNYTQKKNE